MQVIADLDKTLTKYMVGQVPHSVVATQAKTMQRSPIPYLFGQLPGEVVREEEELLQFLEAEDLLGDGALQHVMGQVQDLEVGEVT